MIDARMSHKFWAYYYFSGFTSCKTWLNFLYKIWKLIKGLNSEILNTGDLLSSMSLTQCFSTGVPRHIIVPWASSRCAAKYFSRLLFHFYSLSPSFIFVNTKEPLDVVCQIFWAKGVPQIFFECEVCRQPKKVENHCFNTSLVSKSKSFWEQIEVTEYCSFRIFIL